MQLPITHEKAVVGQNDDIECIGAEKFSDTNDSLRPVYRAYGVVGKWSGPFLPPKIGSRVKINFNGLGTGTVADYFCESRWLGVRVKLDKEPSWRSSNPRQAGTPTMVFGAEITPL